MFPKSWPMRGGKWPKDHPCASNSEAMIFDAKERPADTDGLGKFRMMGYQDASCFPEGDGICFETDESETDAAHRKDIDLSLIAVKHGGGGHRGACGFTCAETPFPDV